MLQGIDVNQRVKFSCKKDVDPKTIFILKPVSGLESLGTTTVKGALIKSIVEIKNPDCSGDKIEEFLGKLDSKSIVEILEECNKLSQLSDDEQKN